MMDNGIVLPTFGIRLPVLRKVELVHSMAERRPQEFFEEGF